MDRRRFNKGTIGNKGGRKPKSEEMKLIEQLDKIINRDDVIRKLKELIDKGDYKAIQLYLNYVYGKPRESKEISVTTEQPLFHLGNLDVEDIDSEEVKE